MTDKLRLVLKLKGQCLCIIGEKVEYAKIDGRDLMKEVSFFRLKPRYWVKKSDKYTNDISAKSRNVRIHC